jgi:hypothetical protein
LRLQTIRALRSIFAAAAAGKPGVSAALQQIAQAFQSCQAEQGRTIDAQYGRLSGRDASFRQVEYTICRCLISAITD